MLDEKSRQYKGVAYKISKGICRQLFGSHKLSHLSREDTLFKLMSFTDVLMPQQMYTYKFRRLIFHNQSQTLRKPSQYLVRHAHIMYVTCAKGRATYISTSGVNPGFFREGLNIVCALCT